MRLVRTLVSVSAVAIAIMLSSVCALAAEDAVQGGKLNYSWATPKMIDDLWGLAFGDVDGDGEDEALAITRGFVIVGQLTSKGLARDGICEWSEDAQATRVYAVDANGDGDDEIIVSAVSDGMPSSIVLDYKGRNCEVLAMDVNMSLRAFDVYSPEKRRVLAGQPWASSQYFFGPMIELKLVDGKLGKVGKLESPPRAGIYQYSYYPTGEQPSVVILKGNAHIEFRTKVGKKFKKEWRSPTRFGGTINFVQASQRDPMGSESSEVAMFDVPTLASVGTKERLIAVYQDMPVHSVIGRNPYIKSAEVVVFVRDPNIGFVEEMRSPRLPGAVIDMATDRQGKTLYVLVQEGAGFFMDERQSAIFAFDLRF